MQSGLDRLNLSRLILPGELEPGLDLERFIQLDLLKNGQIVRLKKESYEPSEEGDLQIRGYIYSQLTHNAQPIGPPKIILRTPEDLADKSNLSDLRPFRKGEAPPTSNSYVLLYHEQRSIQTTFPAQLPSDPVTKPEVSEVNQARHLSRSLLLDFYLVQFYNISADRRYLRAPS